MELMYEKKIILFYVLRLEKCWLREIKKRNRKRERNKKQKKKYITKYNTMKSIWIVAIFLTHKKKKKKKL